MGRLTRQGLPARAGGGLLGITAASAEGDPERIAREIWAECRHRAMGGVLWDLPADCGPDPIRQIGSRLAGRGLVQLVPVRLAEALPQARVLIPGAVTGGSFSELLALCTARYGRRCCLEPVRLACDFPMPARDGVGVRLEQADLERLLTQAGGSRFCPTLCTRYFTHTVRGMPHFVLFDDPDSAGTRLQLAREAGISSFLIRRRDWGPAVPALLGRLQ